ncbi:MAG: hypothetical protein QXF82_09555 [Nitrososphaeria archaeon]
MTVWLERSESRFLDLITTCTTGLVKASSKGSKPTKYELFKAGSKSLLFNRINPAFREDIINDLAKASGGRYTREFAYVLLALDFATDEHAKRISSIKLDDFDDIRESKFTQFIQSTKSTYLPTKDGIEFSKSIFASKDWCRLISKKVLGYGYFDRWLDVIDILTELNLNYFKNDEISFACLKNLIGPFDSRVKGSGPDFIQNTFKTWAFFLDIIDIKTKGKLSNYNLDKKLAYLRKHTGYITDGNGAYRILRNLSKAHVVIKRDIPKEIRVMNFMRLLNLEIWRRDFNRAIATALRRTRLLFMLENTIKPVSIKTMFGNDKLKEIMEHFDCKLSKGIILDDLLFLEATGVRLETTAENTSTSFTRYILNKLLEKQGTALISELESINSRNIFYEKAKTIFQHVDFDEIKIKPLRKFNINEFNLYAPSGKLIEWIKTN